MQVGNVPANMAYFGGYELGRALIPSKLPRSSVPVRSTRDEPQMPLLPSSAGSWGAGRDVCAGALAQLVAGVVFTPLDIVKERMQVGGAPCACMQVGRCVVCRHSRWRMCWRVLLCVGQVGAEAQAAVG